MAVAIKKAVKIMKEVILNGGVFDVSDCKDVFEERAVEEIADKEFDLAQYCLKDWEALKNQIDQLTAKVAETELWLAKHFCPYSPGMRLKTNKGLGLVGLVVTDVIAPKWFTLLNRWEVVCFAIAKNGEVTKRTVSFDERMVKYDALVVTIVQGEA